MGIPDYFYKILLWKADTVIYYMAFIAPNTDSVPKQIDIKELEKLSGLNFVKKANQ